MIRRIVVVVAVHNSFLSHLASDEAIRNTVEKNGGSAAVKKYLNDLFKPSKGETYFEGSRGKKVPYNLENLTDAMTGGNIRGAQQTMVEGLGKAAARNAQKIGSVQEMHNRAEWSLIDPEKEKAYNEETQKAYFTSLENLPYDGSQWNKLDAGTQAISVYNKGKKTTDGMQSALYRQGFGKANLVALRDMNERGGSIERIWHGLLRG
jgi:hypothetical protein